MNGNGYKTYINTDIHCSRVPQPLTKFDQRCAIRSGKWSPSLCEATPVSKVFPSKYICTPGGKSIRLKISASTKAPELPELVPEDVLGAITAGDCMMLQLGSPLLPVPELSVETNSSAGPCIGSVGLHACQTLYSALALLPGRVVGLAGPRFCH